MYVCEEVKEKRLEELGQSKELGGQRHLSPKGGVCLHLHHGLLRLH